MDHTNVYLTTGVVDSGVGLGKGLVRGQLLISIKCDGSCAKFEEARDGVQAPLPGSPSFRRGVIRDLGTDRPT